MSGSPASLCSLGALLPPAVVADDVTFLATWAAPIVVGLLPVFVTDSSTSGWTTEEVGNKQSFSRLKDTLTLTIILFFSSESFDDRRISSGVHIA